jgi:hypothetical protein
LEQKELEKLRGDGTLLKRSQGQLYVIKKDLEQRLGRGGKRHFKRTTGILLDAVSCDVDETGRARGASMVGVNHKGFWG